MIPDPSVASQEQEGKGVTIPHQGKQLPPGVEKISYNEGLEGGMEKKKGGGQKARPRKIVQSVFLFIVRDWQVGHFFKSLDADVARCAPGIGREGDIAIVTNTAILAGIKSLHIEFARFFFRCAHPHFKGLVMAACTVKSHIYMAFVTEDNAFYRTIEHNHVGLLHVTAVTDFTGFRTSGVERCLAVMAGSTVLTGV